MAAFKNGGLYIKQKGSVPDPLTNHVNIYANSDGEIYARYDDGTEKLLTGSTIVSGGTGITSVFSAPQSWIVSVDDYISKTEVAAISGGLQIQIDSNDIDISNLQTDVSNLQIDVTNLQTDVADLSAAQDDFVKKTGDTMTGTLVVNSANVEITGGGKLFVNEVSFSTSVQSGVDVNTVIDQIPVEEGNACFWDVLVNDGTNFRASRITAVWDEDDPPGVRFNEIASESIGDTSNIDLNVSYHAGSDSIRLKASPSTGIWNIKFIRKLL